jgi:hypothetical protein
MTLPPRAALGTMHGKEAAIAPPLATLGIALTVAPVDTDSFGTFTAETPRTGSMEDAARAKALAAIAATGLPVGIGSEGAYGPHPYLPFTPLGQELILWHDARTGQEITERQIDPRPLYDQTEAATVEEAEPFLTRIRFPQTAVIIAPSATAAPITKGVRDRDTLRSVLRDMPRAFLQSDMRAHMNIRRMEVIASLATRLAVRLSATCSCCAAPGWGLLRSDPGLLCSDCGTPTRLPAQDIYGCTACRHEIAQPRAGTADPACCPTCNP